MDYLCYVSRTKDYFQEHLQMLRMQPSADPHEPLAAPQ
jgi:hypothetical protein